MTRSAISTQIFEEVTEIAGAGLLVQDGRRRIQKGADASIGLDMLLTLADRYGLNSRPVAAYVAGLLKL